MDEPDGKNIMPRADFGDFPRIHDGNSVGGLSDDAEIMGDQNNRHACFL